MPGRPVPTPPHTQLDHHAHHAAPGRHTLCLLAHDIHRPANIGSLFRLADAFGIEQLWLTGRSCLPPHPKLHQAARSTERRVPYAHADDPLPVVAALRAAVAAAR